MRVGEYELLEGIGRGGTAEVFRARAADGRVVAVKVFSHRTGTEVSVARFAREVRLTQALGASEGFVPALDDGDSPFGSYLVMPLLSGSLRDRLRRGALPIDEALALGREIAGALARAHASGVVHRDIKPENLLFDDAGRWFVADLGLAKHFRPDAPGASMSQVLTRTGDGCGTVGYLAPEQLESAKSVGPAADVFALGSVLYECLAGRPAFEGASPLEVLARLTSVLPPSLRAERPDAPAWLVRVVEQALATAPERRHPDGGALVRALAGPGPARRVRWPVVASAAAASSLLAGLAVSFSGASPEAVIGPTVAEDGETQPDALEAEAAAARAAIADGRLDDARADIAALAERRGPDARALVDRLGWLLRAAEASAALRGGGDPAPSLALLDGAGRAPPAVATEVRRALAGAALACEPPSDAVLTGLLRVEPEVLVDGRFAAWLAGRAAALHDDPRGAARAVELALRADPHSTSPAGVELLIRTSSGSAYLEGRHGDWIDLVIAGLRIGTSYGLFPPGIDRRFPGGLVGELEGRVAARPDDWGAALFLSLTLLRTDLRPDTPPDRKTDHTRGVELAARVLDAPDLSLHGRAFAHEARGLHLFGLDRHDEGVAALEAALAAWHPRPDELCRDLSRWAREADRLEASLVWAEQACALRERRAEGTPDEGRPRGLPLASLDGVDIDRARIDVRVAVFDRLIRLGRLERAEQMISEIGAVPSGLTDARLAAIAHAFASGLGVEAFERARALGADPQVRTLRQHGGWLPELIGDLPGGGRKVRDELRRALGISSE